MTLAGVFKRVVDSSSGVRHCMLGLADLELKANGSVAFRRGLRLVDSGPELELSSLEVRDSILTWTNDGASRTATLD